MKQLKVKRDSFQCLVFFCYSRGIISLQHILREEEERNYQYIQERCCNSQLNYPYCRFMYTLQVNVQERECHPMDNITYNYYGSLFCSAATYQFSYTDT